MRILQIFGILFLISFSMLGQQNPEIGEKLVIQSPKERTYDHLNFPNTNFIIKKNGVANYKSLSGVTVVVSEIKNNSKNTVILKRLDGRKFFNTVYTISANFEEAMKSGELKKRDN